MRRVRAELRRVAATHLAGRRASLCVDVGGGTSRYRDVLPSERFVSLDIAARDSTSVVGDLTALPLASGSVELITCLQVLEHVRDTRAALSECRRVLTPNGHLIVAVPLLYGEHDVVDYWRWTRLGMRTALEDAGLEVLEVTAYGGYFMSLGVMLGRFPGVVLGRASQGWTANGDARDYARYALHAALGLPFTLAANALERLDRLDVRQDDAAGLIAVARRPALPHTDGRP